MKYPEILKQEEAKHTELFKATGLFWAFSNEQFEKNKTPLQEGDKYVSIGAGGYLPKSNCAAFAKGMKDITKWKKEAIKAHKLKDAQILYDLQNYECFYTCDISPVVEQGMNEADVRRVYNANKKHYNN